ncbi:MAG: carbohydrate porin [Bdellovibrionales bacterium]|nr:carbohydrate porin [Bdellovibrionales bacterium]
MKLLQLLSLIILISTQAYAESEEHFFGDWGGLQSYFEKNGITSEAVLTIDSMSNVSGGSEKNSATLGNFDLAFAIDTEKLGLWKNGTFFFYGLANFGDSISEHIGDLQGVDNIEAYGTAKLYEAWYEHNITEKLSFLFGLHDYNSEFYALEHSSGLINSSFGIGVDSSQAGPSIFPTTALGGRIKLAPSDQFYLLLATYDGLPGSANDQSGTQISWDSDEGFFHAAELGILGEEDSYYKLALGGWWHTLKFSDYSENARDENYGVYSIAEKSFNESIGAFLQLGWADENRNQVVHYYGTGLTYLGLLPNRPDDLLSFGVAIAEISDEFRKSFSTKSTETVFEINYRIEATPYLAITPDLQFVLNPGADPALKRCSSYGI